MQDSRYDEPNEGPAEAPDELVSLVRDALSHLYDYAHLQRHPLQRLLGAAPAEDAARSLRNLMLDTLEQLNPGDTVSRNDKEWRPYGILVRRYVDGFGIDEIVDELHISVRQFQREHRKGLLAAASILRGRWPQEQPLPATLIRPTNELQAEVAELGVIAERVDTGLLLSDVLAPARALAEARQVSLSTSFACNEASQNPVPDSWAWADRTLARQAILGALSAMIASQPAAVTVACTPGAETVSVRLEATGTAALGAERFATVAELMQAQGGSLRVEADAQATGLQVSLEFRRARGARVLVVDDNERVQQLFERYLAADGFAVSCAGEAEEALALVRQVRPDAIVLDVMMRNTDGWQLLQRFRADPDLAGVPVVVCSVLDEPELAIALGAHGYLKKPVSQERMLATVRAALAGDGVAPTL